MLLKTKNIARRRRQARAAQRELDTKFETLTDRTFLDRATQKPVQMPKYNAIFSKEK